MKFETPMMIIVKLNQGKKRPWPNELKHLKRYLRRKTNNSSHVNNAPPVFQFPLLFKESMDWVSTSKKGDSSYRKRSINYMSITRHSSHGRPWKSLQNLWFQQ